MTQNKIRLLDLFRYYKALPHQMAAVSELEIRVGLRLGANRASRKTTCNLPLI
jgi:hypothetical protein